METPSNQKFSLEFDKQNLEDSMNKKIYEKLFTSSAISEGGGILTLSENSFRQILKKYNVIPVLATQISAKQVFKHVMQPPLKGLTLCNFK